MLIQAKEPIIRLKIQNKPFRKMKYTLEVTISVNWFIPKKKGCTEQLTKTKKA